MTGAPETLRPLAPDEAKHFGWTETAPAKTVIAALEAAAPGAARFVGGCVRDSLIGEAPKDFDIATRLAPPAVIAALKRDGLGAAPTGLDHGTVTAVANHIGVEVTTLRADVSTDGRRATVAFTEDWALDARRRDFRLNAIYLTADKKLYDPEGGVADAKAGRVRFIGAAHDRIREDYLRILRFFRFSARFSAAFDAEGLAACAELKSGIAQLSAERIGDEFSKILALARASLAVDRMAQSSILHEIWPAPPRLDVFAALKALDPEAGAPLGLAALWGAARRGDRRGVKAFKRRRGPAQARFVGRKVDRPGNGRKGGASGALSSWCGFVARRPPSRALGDEEWRLEEACRPRRPLDAAALSLHWQRRHRRRRERRARCRQNPESGRGSLDRRGFSASRTA
ncbi:MAG: CCA tRNA nucleotidyltransferase [Parvularculaceae bacterium]